MPNLAAVMPRRLPQFLHHRPLRQTNPPATLSPAIPAPIPSVMPPPGAPLSALQQRLVTDADKVRRGTLHPWCQSFLHQSVRGTPSAVVLLLHGFTAGPWQFFHISQKLTQGGVDVYAPRLPGHGRLHNNEPEPDKLPGLKRQDRYHAFAEEAYQEAKTYARQHGVPLRVMGFSLGGALAADLASAHPTSITRLVAAAPFLKPKPLKGRVGFAAARVGRHSTYGRNLLRQRQFEWIANAPACLPKPLPGYWRFPLSKLYGCLDYNRHLRQRLKPTQMPTQVIITDYDNQCDSDYTRAWFKKASGPHYLFAVARSRKVGHADLAEVDSNGPSHMTQVACRFLLTGEGTHASLSGP